MSHPGDIGDSGSVDSFVATPTRDGSSPSSEMWLTAEELAHSVGGGPPVYVTVDTSQAIFPDVSSLVASDNANAEVASNQSLSTLGFGDAHLALSGGGTKLETLAHAATSQLSLENATLIVTSAGSSSLLSGTAASSLSAFMCGECSFSFASVQDFFQHWLDHHCQPQIPVEAESLRSAASVVERCFTCNRIFVSGTRKCVEHAAVCGGNTVPTHTAATFMAAVEAEGRGSATKRKAQELEESGSEQHDLVVAPSHAKTIKKSTGCVSCGICSSNVRTVTSFFLHWLDSHRHISEILEEVWQCGHCTPHRLFPSRQGLKEHVGEEHAADPVDSAAFSCASKSCDVSYGSAEELERHRGLHAEQPYSECAVCGGFFADLVDHTRTEHEQRCDLCTCSAPLEGMSTHLANNHKFVQVWNRKESLQKVVVKDREVEIHPATSSYSLPSDAKTVVKEKKVVTTSTVVATTSSSSSSTTGSRCKACQMFFTSEKLLEKHYYANHEFQCKFCDKKMDKDLYGDHLRLHLATERKKGVGGSTSNARKHVQ